MGVLLLVAVLFMGMLLGRDMDSPDSALEEREAQEDAAGVTQENTTSEPEPIALEFSGTQNQATEPFELSEGLMRLEVSYEGEGDIIVSAFDEAGESYSLL